MRNMSIVQYLQDTHNTHLKWLNSKPDVRQFTGLLPHINAPTHPPPIDIHIHSIVLTRRAAADCADMVLPHSLT